MTLEELIQFINQVDKKLIDYYGDRKIDKEKMVLYRTVKLGEEFGELCDEILSSSASQRKEKLNRVKKNNLPDEFADVLFTTLLLARSMDIDMEKAIKSKIRKINKRFK